MTWLTCPCSAVYRVSDIVAHVQPDDDEPLVGGDCPQCGSTHYVPLARLSVNELAALPCIEVLGSGAVVLAADV